ncbi:MAG TPA: hypothetical protein ENI64_00210 [Gammaproteobacteria bacterium]|nr:hypothetical protein [Gammaproteobacteria bacterium]
MPCPTNTEIQKGEPFFEKVLAGFSAKFSSLSPGISNTSCISKSLLVKHLISIRDELEFPGYRRISGKRILLHLVRSKIVHSITTLDPKSGQAQDKFYLLGFTSNESMVDPIELLQALVPEGVICYFTALEFYGLTTQIPGHHHVAKLIKSPLTAVSKGGDSKKYTGKNRLFDPLGNKKFIYEDIPFYITARAENLVPGIKVRFLNEKIKFRITTLEQTLIDTLHKPLSCGGSSVVFEAWQNAKVKIKNDAFLECLQKINSIPLSSRVGYMLHIMNYTIKGDLSDYLNSVKNSINKDKPELATSLLPGFDYHQINQEWFVRVP